MNPARNNSPPVGRTTLLTLVSVVTLCCFASALPSYYGVWQGIYPGSSSGLNVVSGTGSSCQLCHQAPFGGNGYNGYGWGIRQGMFSGLSTAEAIQAIEPDDSDVDPQAASNLDEIGASTQPGWTDGAKNTVYFNDGSMIHGQFPPPGILGTLDPAAAPGDISVSPALLDFGPVVVGATSTLTATIANLGGSDLTITGLSVSGSLDFALGPAAPPVPVIIPPGGAAAVPVDYFPGEAGSDSGTLQVLSDDPDQPSVLVPLFGSGIPPVLDPDIHLNPSILAFGQVPLGASATLTTTIHNLGSIDLSVTGFFLAGSPFFDLAPAAPLPPFVVPAGGAVELELVYAPAALGDDSGSLEVASDDPDEPTFLVSLTGSGVPAAAPEIDVWPLDIDFFTAVVGATSTIRTTISNLGGADLTVTDLPLSGSFDFSLGAAAPAVPFVVPAGASVEVPIDYTPSEVGDDAGALEVLSDDPAAPGILVTLAGSGIPVELAPDVSYWPAELVIGEVPVGEASSRQVTLYNTGMSSLVVTGLTLTGTPEIQPHPLNPPVPIVIPPFALRAVAVTYTPADFGEDSATLELTLNDPDEASIVVPITGAGIPVVGAPEIDVAPLALDFGPVNAGATSTLTTTIRNLGDTELAITGLAFTGSLDFDLNPSSPATPFVVPAVGELDIAVDYTPVGADADTGTLEVLSDDPDEPVVAVSLAGIGIASAGEADILVSPPALAFGSVEVGTLSTLSATIENQGTGDLTVTALTLTGSPEFTLGPSAPLAPFTLPPGGSVPLPVEYAPADIGDDSGIINVASNDPDEPLISLPLTATGFDPSVADIDVTPLVLNFGTVTVGTSSTLAVSIANLGNVELTVTGLTLAASPEFAFHADAPLPPFILLAGESAEVPVVYTPAEGGFDGGSLEVASDDPDEPLVVVQLAGSGFQTVVHPQATTDCANCHLSPATGEPDLQGLHGFDCGLCHESGFGSTILGPLGTWDGECAACHNPDVAQTGNLQSPTKGHRCIVCHGSQRPIGDVRRLHDKHTKKANCVVCHGFIPDLGFSVGSADYTNCSLCHQETFGPGVGLEIHKEMVPEGLSCEECHGGVRPPVDVFPGPPVGGTTVVCELCHDNVSPGQFGKESERLHKKHTKKRIDCGACHADAHFQDDRVPMPALDDPRRASIDRAGYNECVHCHEGGESAKPDRIHKKHVAKMWQWCFNCHEDTDLRPTGEAPPVTQPSEACVMCHNNEPYDDTTPFWVHKKHAGKNKCYACHQTVPDLFDWPSEWLAPEIPPPGVND